MRVAGAIRDAGPGRVGPAGHPGPAPGPVCDSSHDTAELGVLTYLLESNSDRIGALDFQTGLR